MPGRAKRRMRSLRGRRSRACPGCSQSIPKMWKKWISGETLIEVQMEYPVRKQIRLKDYDYSKNGAYFVTICTENRMHLFPFVGAAPCGRPHPAREIAETWMQKIPEKFPQVSLCHYVIMPNHVHILLVIDAGEGTGGHMGPPLQAILDWYKTMTTNAYIRNVREGTLPPFQKRIWQRGYYEHIVRNESDYLNIWTYIDQNPARWTQDEYYQEERERQP